MRIDDVADQLRALADPLRLRILRALAVAGALEVGALAETLERPQPTISRHLARLLEAGLVEVSAHGRHRRYRLSDTPSRLQRALLETLAGPVARTPAAAADVERAEALTAAPRHETKELHKAMTPRASHDDEDRVFSALRHPCRRRMLDILQRRPGCAVSEVAAEFEMSRVAVTRHLDVLEHAGLVHSTRRGRERALYANVVPIQVIYDRWTTRYSAPLARHMTAVKRAAETS